jgi:hypothetical protein
LAHEVLLTTKPRMSITGWLKSWIYWMDLETLG